MMEKQNWNPGSWDGSPALWRCVNIVVGDEPAHIKESIEKSSPEMKRYLWFVPFIGTERQAIEVQVDGEDSFFMDNKDGSGLKKILAGGWIQNGHRSVYPSKVLGEVKENDVAIYNVFARKNVDQEIDDGWMKIDPDGYAESKKTQAALLELIRGKK